MSAESAYTRLKTVIQLALGLTISGIALYLAAGRADWPGVREYVSRADWRLMLGGGGVLLASLGVFGLRWRALMPAPTALSTRRAFSYLMVGYLANTVMPLHLGDAARLGLASRRSGLRPSLLLGTLAVERLLDLLLLASAGVGLGLFVATPAALTNGVRILLAAALGGLVGLGVLRVGIKPGRLFEILARGQGLRGAAGRWAGRQAEGFRAGLSALRGPPDIGRAGGLSILGWGGIGLATGLWVLAFGLPVPWYGVALLVVGVNLGAALPSAPAGIGVYHLVVLTILSTWVTDRDQALAYAVASHGLNSALNVSVGLGCLLAEWPGCSASPPRAPAEALG